MGFSGKTMIVARATGRHVKIRPTKSLKPKSNPRALPNHINIKQEYQLILDKKSKLSKTLRDAILDFYNQPVYKRFWYYTVALGHVIRDKISQPQK